jgi:hypothetical protein
MLLGLLYHQGAVSLRMACQFRMRLSAIHFSSNIDRHSDNSSHDWYIVQSRASLTSWKVFSADVLMRFARWRCISNKRWLMKAPKKFNGKVHDWKCWELWRKCSCQMICGLPAFVLCVFHWDRSVQRGTFAHTRVMPQKIFGVMRSTSPNNFATLF